MGFALSEMRLRSSAFEPGREIPAAHAADGGNLSPAVSWSGAPDGTRSFAIFVHDPDAPLVTPDGKYGYVHWVLYNIPAATTEVDEGSTAHTAGLNQQGEPVYFGPQPPAGHGVHHYFFTLLALDRPPELPAGLTLWELLEAVEPHLLAMNRLVGTYEQPAT